MAAIGAHWVEFFLPVEERLRGLDNVKQLWLGIYVFMYFFKIYTDNTHFNTCKTKYWGIQIIFLIFGHLIAKKDY